VSVDGHNLVSPSELLRTHYAWQHGAFVSTTAEFPGGLAAFSNLAPVPMWNHAAWIEGGQDEFPSFLASTAEWQSRKNRRPVVYVAEPTAEQLRALKTAGCEKFDEEAWMISRGGSPSRSPRAREAGTEAETSDLVSVFYTAFSIKQEGYERALRRPDPKTRHFVLYDEETPVSAGTLMAVRGLACIYNIGTPARFRGQGFGRELFEHLCATAFEGGCETIFLQVENDSAAHRLYEKCGFRATFVRHGFRLKEWRPPQTTQTRLGNVLGCRPSSDAILYSRETRAIPAVLAQKILALPGCSPRRVLTGAWAYLLHRYTGDETVSFTLEADRIEVPVIREQSINAWLREPIQPSTRPEAVESLICLGSASHRESRSFPIEIHLLGDLPETLQINYRTDLFSKDAIRRMGAHLATILESITSDPDARVSQIEILPARERNQLFVDWNQTPFQLTDRLIQQLFELQVERAPDATALAFAKAGVTGPAAQMTYRQLNRRANRLAHRLQTLGVGPEVFVGVCLKRSLDMVVSLLAIFKAGGACVPLDPAYPVERLAFILRDTKAPVVLTEKSQSACFPHLSAKMILLDDPWPSGSGESERNLVSNVSPGNAAYVIYTSGSTGQPKGVVVPHHAIANHSIDCRTVYGLSGKDRVLQFSSFNFDASLEQILSALISGATLVVRDGEVWSTREFENKLADFQLTVADIPTAYWHQLADEWSKRDSVPANTLRLVIVGGEALSPEKLALWQQTAMNATRLINAYGPTETVITSASHEIPARKSGDPSPAQLPIGRPRADRQAYVLDAFGNPTPIGVPGELHLGGTLLARGYHNRPELTAARFIANPFSDEAGARLYKTGDLVRYLEDGNLEFLGRIDDQVKIRGFRIELGEVESCLRSHPAVGEAVVLAASISGGEKRLAAYAASNGRPLATRDLRAHLREKLPEYMLPATITILDQIPLLPSGKIDRRALPEPGEETPLEGGLRGPRDPLELQLQLLFERVLKRAAIGIDISFFELGGDSLQALELLVEIERATGTQLPMGTLYQSSTVETLARELRRRTSNEEWSCLVPMQISGERPPLFFLHTTPGDILGYGNLVYRLGPDQPCHGFQSLGLKDSRLSHQTVAEMARYYVELLRECHPRGPYFLGGWCYGGIVAVEMARLLKDQGEEVALLALLETIALPPRVGHGRYYAHRLRCLWRMSPARWLGYVREKVRYIRQSRIDNRRRFRQVDGAGTVAADGEIRDPRLARLEQVYNSNMRALAGYRSRFYDGRVVLFNAAEKDPALIPDPHYGWVGLAREVEIHEVPGNHDTMLTEPNVLVLARELSECLQRARAQFEATQS
jgi:amino acid adenylation domain-containing protein